MKKIFYYISLLLLSASCAKFTPAQPQQGKGEGKGKWAPTEKKAETSQQSPSTPSPSTYRIMLDPGHGGEDPGAKSIVRPYVREKVLTLKTAKKVEEFLSKWGYQVYMTRRKDLFIPLQERVELAKKKNCNLFVSIHFNSTPKPTAAHGAEIYYYSNEKKFPKIKDARAKQSRELAAAILRRMAPATKAKPRGVHVGNYAVIRETMMPAVLIEAGFLSNSAEAKKLNNPNYIRFLSWSIAKGIDDYVVTRQDVPGAN